MSKRANEPAMPQNRCWNAERAEYEDTQQHPGLTLREHFAGLAMQGLVNGLRAEAILFEDHSLAENIARAAQIVADKTLAELERTP